MRGWRVLVGCLAAAAVSSAAQTPVLSSIGGSNPALQNAQPIHLAGNTYSAGQVAYGSIGTPLVLLGSNFGDEGEVWFVACYNAGTQQDPNACNQQNRNENTAGSVQAAVTLWSPTAISLSVPAGALSGLVYVVTNGKSSNGLPFLVMQGTYSASCQSGPTQNPLQIQTSSLQDGAVNKSYSATLHATGGSSSYTWSILGSLPAGLALSSATGVGVVSGTPTTASGPVSVTVQVADTSTPQQYDSATLSIEIAAQPEPVSSATLYNFTIGSYDSVGNVKAYTDSVNGTWSFNYDTLNRLANASGGQADDPYPNYCWQYDSFGNRLWQTSSATAYASTAGGPSACAVTAGPSSGASYNANNQISDGLHGYDTSGNMTQDATTGNSYLYDGEGRICAVSNTPVQGITTMTQYLYDAEGNRVAKGNITQWSCDNSINSSTHQPNNGFTPQSAYVLGPHNEQLTEMTNNSGTWQLAHTNVDAGVLGATYDADLTGKTAGPLYFHLSDWLGTRRQQTDYAGNAPGCVSVHPVIP